jgi:hypothetical protein
MTLRRSAAVQFTMPPITRTFTGRALLAAAIAGAARLPAQALPTPAQLAARHDSAVGGRAALDGYKSLHLLGTFSLPAMGIESPLEIMKLRPNIYFFRVTLGQMGEMSSGYDGKNAWAVQPGQGPMVFSGEQAATLAEQADFYASFKDFSRYASVETLDETDFEGKRAYRIRITRKSGEVLTEYYDVATGLSLGGVSSVDTPQGKIESTTVFAEYQQFGALRLASRIIQRNAQFEVILVVKEVKFDTLNEAAAAPPDAVKALIKP